MPWNVPPELWTGPVSGLVIALVFAGVMYKMVLTILNQMLKRIDEIIAVFKSEMQACEARYTQLLEEVLKLKDRG